VLANAAHPTDLLLGIPSSHRAEKLKRWGFKCTCSLCALDGQEKKASDLRRVMIAQSEEKIVRPYYPSQRIPD